MGSSALLPTPTAALMLQIHQAADKCTELVLNAKFSTTLAFYTWHALKQEQYPDPAAVSAVWQADVQGLVHQFKDTFSIGRSVAECAEALEKLYCVMADASALLTAPFQPSQGFTTVPDQEELLRYVVDKLMVSAKKIRRQSVGLPPDSANHHIAAVWQAPHADSTDKQYPDMQRHTHSCSKAY